MKQKMLRQGNIYFMEISSYTISNSDLFLDALKRANLDYKRARYDGLQSLNPPQGFIFMEPISATNILTAINENKYLLTEFSRKVAKVSEGKYVVRDDCSRIEVPFKDKFYGDYNLALDIFGYTLGAKRSFKPIKNPLGLSQSTKIERLANLEFIF